jgi:hypothetical protein
VNLRPDEDVETEFVAFDRPRVVRVLERIAADLDTLSLVPNDPRADKESNHHDPRARHRHELAETPPKPKKLTESSGGRCEQRWDYRHSKKIRPCAHKTEHLLALFLVPLLPLPHYGERYRHDETISTGFVESTVNQVVSKRFVKKQRMQWTPRGAHLRL